MELKEDKGFTYVDEGEGEVVLLLHGLFGALSNWDSVVNHFSKNYRVIIPLLPIYTMPFYFHIGLGFCLHDTGFI